MQDPKKKIEISQNFFSLIKLYSFKYLIACFELILITIVKAVCINYYVCHTKMGVVCKKDSAKSSQELFTRQNAKISEATPSTPARDLCRVLPTSNQLSIVLMSALRRWSRLRGRRGRSLIDDNVIVGLLTPQETTELHVQSCQRLKSSQCLLQATPWRTWDSRSWLQEAPSLFSISSLSTDFRATRRPPGRIKRLFVKMYKMLHPRVAPNNQYWERL